MQFSGLLQIVFGFRRRPLYIRHLLSLNHLPHMANSCIWDPATNAFMVTIGPPDRPALPTWNANVQLSATPPNTQVTSRVYSSYQGPPANGKGFGYSWWQAPPVGNQNWIVPGPAFGAAPVVFYIQPTYRTADESWHVYPGPPSHVENQWSFTDPSGGGSTSIIVTMVESGGGGPDM